MLARGRGKEIQQVFGLFGWAERYGLEASPAAGGGSLDGGQVGALANAPQAASAHLVDTQPRAPAGEFCGKMERIPRRREAFVAWHREIANMLDDLVRPQGKGLPAVASRMAESFDPDVVKLSVQRYGDQLRRHTEEGTIRMTKTGLLTTTAAGSPVRRHTFYGQHTDPGD